MENSDESLFIFLVKCNNCEVFYLIKYLKSKFCKGSLKLSRLYPNEDSVPNPNTEERIKLAEDTIELLRWYGSNAIAYGLRKVAKKEGGVHYHHILHDAAKIINKTQKRKERKKLPRVASVPEWEELITEILLSKALNNLRNKSSHEIANMFKEAGLEKEVAENAAKIYGTGAVGISLPMLTKTLGKRTVKMLIENIIIQITQKRLGKDAAVALAKRLVLKFPQRVIVKMLNIIGWIWLSVDVLLFATSPARRITIPTVAFISTLRTRERTAEND